MGRGRKKARAKGGGGSFKDFGNSPFVSGGAFATLGPQYQAWLDAQDQAQDAAVGWYTGSGYRSANRILRATSFDDLSQSQKDNVTALQQTLDQAPGVAQNMMLHRGFGYPALWNAAQAGNLKSGDVLTDPAFMSSSTTSGTAVSFASTKTHPVVYRMRVPQGIKGGGYIAPKGVAGESEFLWRRGTSVRIDAVNIIPNPHGSGRPDVVMLDVTVQ